MLRPDRLTSSYNEISERNAKVPPWLLRHFLGSIDSAHSLIALFGFLVGGMVAAHQEKRSEVSDSIFELQQVRNVVAHNYGIADKHFCEKCPRFNLKQGDEVNVGSDQLIGYLNSMFAYCFMVVGRLGKLYGFDSRALVNEATPGAGDRLELD